MYLERSGSKFVVADGTPRGVAVFRFAPNRGLTSAGPIMTVRCKSGKDKGNMYCGEFDGVTMQGVGVLEEAACRYWGSFEAGVRQGLGVKIWFDKDDKSKVSGTYAGQYAFDKAHGLGCMTYDDGSKWSGEWVNTEQHGRGVHQYTNGSVFIGRWQNQKVVGELVPYKWWNPSHRSFLKKLREVEVRMLPIAQQPPSPTYVYASAGPHLRTVVHALSRPEPSAAADQALVNGRHTRARMHARTHARMHALTSHECSRTHARAHRSDVARPHGTTIS